MNKNQLKVSLNKLIKYLDKPWVLFLIFCVIGTLIFFLRFPNNFFEPNFYAEDGSIFMLNIEKYGFLKAFFTTFNGYYVFGIYLLEGAGYIINFLFSGGLIDLARSFALISYIFLGTICALPILLFRNRWGLSVALLIFLLSVFVPMPGYDYSIIGTIGNLKFIFVYLAFLLLIYRHFASEDKLIKVIAIDIIIAICAYTNVAVYLLMPFAVLKYIRFLNPKKNKLKKIIKLRSFQSLLLLGILLVPQIIVIKIFGLPSMAGYLDTPYQWNSTINLFIFRPFLYPIFIGLTKYMTDILVVCLFCILSVFLWISIKKNRELLIFGYLTIFFITFLFVANRTGIGDLFTGYSSGGPDQFFYTQNLIICFLLGLSIPATLRHFKKILSFKISYLIILILIIITYAPAAGTYGENNFMQSTVKNIYTQAQYECNQNDSINIQLYPAKNDLFQLKDLDRNKICTENITNYIPDTEYTDETTKDNSYISDITKTSAYQTFHSKYNGLDGVSLMVLTYGQKIKDDYIFNLYKSDCSTLIESYRIKQESLKDAKYTRIPFDKIANSKNQKYCFSISTNKQASTPLAIPLSNNHQYKDGDLLLDKIAEDNDFMIRLHYTK